MGDNAIGPITTNVPTSIPPKPKAAKPSRPVASYMFAETVQSFNSSSFAAGFLPVNRPKIKFLMIGGYSQHRWPEGESMIGKKVNMHSYRIEPQLQLDLFKNSNTFLRDSQLYLRFQYDINQMVGSDVPLGHNLTTELTHKFPGELFVLRLNVFSNNLQDPDTAENRLVIAPFLKSPTYNVPILNGIRFRIAPEYSYNFRTREHGLMLHAKIEGDLNSSPWAGWSVQTFWAVDVMGKKDTPGVDFAGLYVWFGSVLPNSWFGPGYFFEGGIWIGKSSFEDGPVPLWKAFVLGLNLKFKFGTDCRWWQ